MCSFLEPFDKCIKNIKLPYVERKGLSPSGSEKGPQNRAEAGPNGMPLWSRESSEVFCIQIASNDLFASNA